MNHYSREELVTAILNYCAEETDNKEDIITLAVTESDQLYKYVVHVSEHLNIPVAKFIKQYYNYEVYRSLHTEA